MTAPDLTAILEALRTARAETEKAYQATTEASHERVVLAGLADDLDSSIRQVRDLERAA